MVNKKIIFFPILIFIISFSGSYQAEAASFTAVQMGDWSDPATWGGIVPGINDDKIIPSGITVSIASGIIENSGTISNSGIIDNSGIITNLSMGVINNLSGGTITNAGTININAGSSMSNFDSISNSGIINNSGTVNNLNGGNISNPGTIANSGSISNLFGGTITNTDTINNFSSGSITNFDTIINSNTINNSGTINNNGVLNNSGTINNCEGSIMGPITGNAVINSCDFDGDTYSGGAAGTDCNDFDASINPGATEIFDGIDNNCDTLIDEGFCIPPSSGDWTITNTCILGSSTIISGNILVQNNSVLTIPSGITLDIDLIQFNLTIESASGVLIQAGGTIN